MKVKVEILCYEGYEKEDCDVTNAINERLEELNITDTNLIDIKFQTHYDEIPEDERNYDIDGYADKIAVLIIYKMED